MNRKHFAMALLAFILIGCGIWFVKYERDKRARAVRERGYQASLAEYSGSLRPGMTRATVEDYLRSNGKDYRQLCCVASSRGELVDFRREGYDDLVRIGQEPVSFVCSDNNVYIALEFNPKAPNESSGTNAADVLKRVSLFHHLEGCL